MAANSPIFIGRPGSRIMPSIQPLIEADVRAASISARIIIGSDKFNFSPVPITTAGPIMDAGPTPISTRRIENTMPVVSTSLSKLKCPGILILKDVPTQPGMMLPDTLSSLRLVPTLLRSFFIIPNILIFAPKLKPLPSAPHSASS